MQFDSESPMQDPDPLREWAAAERMAVMAEEMLRAALINHVERGDAVPPLEMQSKAAELCFELCRDIRASSRLTCS